MKAKSLAILWSFLFLNSAFLFGATYYVATNGNDNNNGTDINYPLKTFKVGMSKLAPGDTLYLRGGVYYGDNQIYVNINGTENSKTLISSYPGERAVIDGSEPEYTSINNNQWDLVDASINLYRSKIQYTGMVDAWGFMPALDSALVPYKTLDDLSSETYVVNSVNDTDIYIGPGLFMDDGYIYVRLEQNTYYNTTDFYGDPLSDLPTDKDPNNNRLQILVKDAYNYKYLFLFGAQTTGTETHYVEFVNIDFENHHVPVAFVNKKEVSHITFTNCYFKTALMTMLAFTGNDTHDITVQDCVFTTQHPEWLYYRDNKRYGLPSRLKTGHIIGALHAWNVINNKFIKTWNPIRIYPTSNDCVFANNLFIGSPGDAIALSSFIKNIEICHNIFRYYKIGISVYGDSGYDVSYKGPVYIHHNIIDITMPVRVSRVLNGTGDDLCEWDCMHPFGSHGIEPPNDGAVYYKVYNNTIIGKTYYPGDVSNTFGLGPRCKPSAEVRNYNNIYYVVNEKPVLDRYYENKDEIPGGDCNGNVYFQENPGTSYLFYAYGLYGYSWTSLSQYVDNPNTNWEDLSQIADPGIDSAALQNDDFYSSFDSMKNLDIDEVRDLYRITKNQETIYTRLQSYSGLDWPGIDDADDYVGALGPKLAAHYKLDETSGTTAYDSVNGLDAAFGGAPGFATGIIDGCLSFDGSDDYLVIQDSDLLAPDKLSISLWFKPAATAPEKYQTLLCKGSAFGCGFVNNKLWFFVDTRGAGGSGEYASRNNIAFARDSNTWFYLVLVYNGDSVRLYIDDNLLATYTLTSTGNPVRNSGGELYIARQATSDKEYQGLIDDVRIYSTNLRE